MAEIEVPEPGDAAGEQGAAPVSPYRNLFVPLIVVPALIVIVLVLVFALFGAIAGEEATPRENLRTMLDGGVNERTQAAFGLARQVCEDIEALKDGDPETAPQWGIGAPFLSEVQSAWSATDEDDYEVRFVLAMVMAYLGDEAGLSRVREMLRGMPPEADESGEIRFFLLQLLGQLGDPSAAPDVIAYLSSDDSGLRQVAAGALQGLPSAETSAALRGALGASELALRGLAAISLTYFADRSGEAVLLELLDPDAYERDRLDDRRRWTRATDVRYTRQRALFALARLHDSRDRAVIERVAQEDEDSEVQATAKYLLERWDELPLQIPPSGSE